MKDLLICWTKVNFSEKLSSTQIYFGKALMQKKNPFESSEFTNYLEDFVWLLWHYQFWNALVSDTNSYFV